MWAWTGDSGVTGTFRGREGTMGLPSKPSVDVADRGLRRAVLDLEDVGERGEGPVLSVHLLLNLQVVEVHLLGLSHRALDARIRRTRRGRRAAARAPEADADTAEIGESGCARDAARPLGRGAHRHARGDGAK